MKGEEKQRKYHEDLLKMLYPPPSPSPQHEDEENKLIEQLNDVPEEDIECSLRSSSDDNEGENGGSEKQTRAQRKRLRKRKLKEAASQRSKRIGPLLPDSNDDRKNVGNIEVKCTVPETVRQNAATNVSGGPSSCSKQKKLTQRRKSKKLASEKLRSSSVKNSTDDGTDP